MFDTDTLKKRAKLDNHIPDSRIVEIENVDIVGSATELKKLLEDQNLLGTLNFIISSHNFEHLANPIKFLQGCGEALMPGGILSMAVPDCRACFDHFRFPTRLTDWLESYVNDQAKPAPKQIFDGKFMSSGYQRDGIGALQVGCDIRSDNPDYFVPNQTLQADYDLLISELAQQNSDYTDSHCSTFFNWSLELMLRDLQYLKLINFEILEITETVGLEFFVHLKKTDNVSISESGFYKKRAEIMKKTNQSLGWAGYKNVSLIEKPVYKRQKKPVLKRIAAEAQRFKRRILER